MLSHLTLGRLPFLGLFLQALGLASIPLAVKSNPRWQFKPLYQLSVELFMGIPDCL